MGICSDSTKAKLVDVGGDLLSELLSSAVELLAVASLEDGHAIPDTVREYFEGDDEQNAAALEKDLQTLTERQFLIQYAYTYNGDRSLPNNMSQLPTAFLTSHEDFVSVPEGDTTKLTDYVDNTILGKGSNLPAWFTKQFTNDLLGTMTTIIQNGNSTWQYEKFDNTYNDPSGQMQPISVNAIMTYANASLTEDGKSASESIIFFAGIYFNSVGFGYAKSIQKFLGGSDDPPPNNYPIVQIGVAAGTVIVATALAVYIARASPPVAGVSFSFYGASLRLILFKWPWQSTLEDEPGYRQPQSRRKGPADVAGPRDLEAAVQGIDSAWAEKLLNQLNFSYTITPGTSDAQTTAEITLLSKYAKPAQKSASRVGMGNGMKQIQDEDTRGTRGAYVNKGSEVNGRGGQGLEEEGRKGTRKQVLDEDARSARGYER